MGEWQHGLFGCFDNIGLCVITYFVPCFQAGKVAEAVGENCILHGILFLLGPIGLYFRAKIRGQIRDQKGIEGSFVNDCLMVWCCTLCALVQEASEMEGVAPQAIDRQ